MFDNNSLGLYDNEEEKLTRILQYFRLHKENLTVRI